MKALRRCLAVCFALAALSVPAWAGGNANFVLGWRGLDEDYWSPVEDQAVVGVTVDFGKEGWPVFLEAGLQGSAGDDNVLDIGDVSVTGSVGELSFGVNKTWQPAGNIRPFIGGGLASVTATYEVDTFLGDVDDDDTSLGVYLHGGVFWRLGKRFNIGVDGRILAGTDITLFGADGDADYAQLGLVLGWGWPAGK